MSEMTGKPWGKIILATRLEKTVESDFVRYWSHLITRGLRRFEIEELIPEVALMLDTDHGNADNEDIAREILAYVAKHARPSDGFYIPRDRVAHKSANEIIRYFLRNTEGDTLALMDSDCAAGYDLVEEMRQYKPGWEYDVLQAFYCRRGWPPEAIWFKRDALGEIVQALVTEDGGHEEVVFVGFHFTFIRREVLDKIWKVHGEAEGIDFDRFEWAWYPRHETFVEDAAFSQEAADLGFKLGATTEIKTGHISRVVTGWETYQQFLEISGQHERIRRHWANAELVGKFLGEEREIVHAKSLRGPQYVQDGIEAFIFTMPDSKAENAHDLSAAELREFYGRSDNGYFYDLVAWNSTPLYDSVLEILAEIEGKITFVVGGGIGGEVDVLRQKNGVIVFELPGALRDFLVWRFKEIEKADNVQIYTDAAHLGEIAPLPLEHRIEFGYDVAVMIDTVEHFHPDELVPTLDRILELVKPDGFLYFRNNFCYSGDYDTHYDHEEAFTAWVADNDLELYAGYDNGLEIYRRSGANV